MLLLGHLPLMLWNYSTDFPNPHLARSYYLQSIPVYLKKKQNKKTDVKMKKKRSPHNYIKKIEKSYNYTQHNNLGYRGKMP